MVSRTLASLKMTKRRVPTRPAARGVLAIFLACGAGAATGLGGCSSVLTPGTTILEYTAGSSSAPQDAPSDGEYVLLGKFFDQTPIATASLRKGDPLGFERDSNDDLYAVWGDQRKHLDDGDYIWKRR